MAKSVAFLIGFNHGFNGTTKSYSPGNRKSGSKARVDYEAGFDQGMREYHEYTKQKRYALAQLNLPKNLRANPVKRKKTARISHSRANKEKYVRRPSQITTNAPSKRLQARRKSTLKAPKGYFANPCGKKKVKKNPIEKTYRVEYRTHSGAGWQIVARFPHTETGRKHAREYAEALFEKHDGKYPVKVID